MLTAIIRKDLTEALRDRRFVLIAILLACLMVVATTAGVARFSSSTATVGSADAATYGQWLNQGQKNPHAAAHYGLYAFKPETPFAFAERGINDYAGQSIWLEAHFQNLAQARSAQDAVSIERLGALTAGFLLQIVMPLLIIVLGFRTFAGERESGVLAQTLAAGAPVRSLLAGKTIGAGAAILAMVAPLIVIGALTLAWLSQPGYAGLSRALLLIVAYGVYAAIWLLLTVGASALMKSSRAALVTLVGLWAVTAFVVPRLAADAARTLAPTPSYQSFKASMDAEMSKELDGETQEQYIARLTAETLARYGVATPEQLPINLMGLRFTWLEARGGRIFDRHFGGLYETYAAQDRVHQWAALLSPLIAIRQVATAIAATDLETHRRFVAAAERHRRAYIDVMNVDMTNNSRTGARNYEASPELWRRIGAFRFTPPPPLASLRLQGIAIGAGLCWLGLAGVAGLCAVRRIRPEML
jgi:ABC-2 type transport system permease protein